MRVKFIEVVVSDRSLIESRINEELKGWKIKKIISIDIKPFGKVNVITLIGEVDE